MTNQMQARPLAAVTQPDPYPYYATLVDERPFYFEEALDLWVASSAAAVDEVFSCPALGVRPVDEPVPPNLAGHPTGDVFRHLIRMSDGERHTVNRPPVEADLRMIAPDHVDRLTREVAEGTLRRLRERDTPGKLGGFMFQVPVGVVARLAGIAAADVGAVAHSVEAFVDALKPGCTEITRDLGDAATGFLVDMLGSAADQGTGSLGDLNGTLERDVALANLVGLLMQSYEATAGLIGNMLVMLRRLGESGELWPAIDERFVREVARFDSSVQNTRRFAAADCRIHGERVERGEAILVILAAANRDPAANPEPHRFRPERESPSLFTFGLGAHHCPGADLAVRITVGALAVLTEAGIEPESLPSQPCYIPSANARIPRFGA